MARPTRHLTRTYTRALITREQNAGWETYISYKVQLTRHARKEHARNMHARKDHGTGNLWSYVKIAKDKHSSLFGLK